MMYDDKNWISEYSFVSIQRHMQRYGREILQSYLLNSCLIKNDIIRVKVINYLWWSKAGITIWRSLTYRNVMRLTLKQTKWQEWYHHKKECCNYVMLIITKQTWSDRNDITLWKSITAVAITTLKTLSGRFDNNIHPNMVKIFSSFPFPKPRSYSPWHGESSFMVTEERGQFS